MQFYYGILVSAFSAVSMFFAVKLADKLGGMKNMVVLAQVMNAAFRVVAFFIGFDTRPKMIAVIAIISISSIPTNMVGIAQRALLCDSIDYTEWKTGKRQEGLCYAGFGFFSKVAAALTKSFGPALVVWAGYVTSTNANIAYATQSQTTLNRFLMIYTIIPAIFVLGQMIPIFFYDLNGKKRDMIAKELQERREKAAALKAAGEEA